MLLYQVDLFLEVLVNQVLGLGCCRIAIQEVKACLIMLRLVDYDYDYQSEACAEAKQVHFVDRLSIDYVSKQRHEEGIGLEDYDEYVEWD